MAIRGIAVTHDAFTDVDTTKRYALGHRVNVGDKAYVYVQGVTSGAAGKWVTFTAAGVTTLSTANGNGMVGILMAALDATTDFGFIQVYGENAIADVTDATAGEALYLTGTGGRLDKTDVAADMVLGVTVTANAASNVCSVFLNYPHVIDVAID
jgi:hypothetical protein